MSWNAIPCGLLLAVALSGCTTLGNMPASSGAAGGGTASTPTEMPAEAAQEAPQEPDCTPPPDDAGKLLTYFEHLKKFDILKMQHEMDVATAAFTRTHSDYNRVRLAMLYTLPDTGFADSGQAVKLLDPVVKKPDAPLHALALLVMSYTREQMRLGKTTQGLQQKLDALKSLDKTLIERDAGKPQHK
ncbi:MAG TPA: hypothetical protein VFM11_00370 [Burkholderiales bacterium]|nr:hypothetical protein [Burkholderiales bacterium]